MWDHYKKTFLGTQIVIAVVTLSVYLFYGRASVPAAVFFIVMQIAAVLGAMWAARLTAALRRKALALPLLPRN